ITKEQYAVLCGYIQHSFKKDSNNHIITVPHDSRYYNGNFYDANGSYSLFKSCNTWVNIGLKKSDISTCLWTPFDWPLLNVYK
ncbi:MAG: DUF2459 domain-containing protein, partial [Cytophagales bacterium]|nr:DUF2459 domain-containing protein [Cytophaga sp.]